MPEVAILLTGLVAVGGMVSFAVIRRPRKPTPQLPESEIHKREFIATGDEAELSKMIEALEREGG